MKVLVTGSRDWRDNSLIRKRLHEIEFADESDVRHELIHGAARGADTIAHEFAFDLGWALDPHKADWSVKPDTPEWRIKTRPDGSRYDSGAGRDRNLEMLDEKPDLVLAFQRNGSSGTQHTIDEARRRGIPVEVITDP